MLRYSECHYVEKLSAHDFDDDDDDDDEVFTLNQLKK